MIKLEDVFKDKNIKFNINEIDKGIIMSDNITTNDLQKHIANQGYIMPITNERLAESILISVKTNVDKHKIIALVSKQLAKSIFDYDGLLNECKAFCCNKVGYFTQDDLFKSLTFTDFDQYLSHCNDKPLYIMPVVINFNNIQEIDSFDFAK